MLGIFLDSEANGLYPARHKMIEIAYQLIDVVSGKLVETFESVIKISPEDWEKSDPASLKINGFTWDEIERGKTPEEIAVQIMESFRKHQIVRGKAVFICQNPSFDRAFFAQLIDPKIQEEKSWPYHWLDLASMFWASALAGVRSGENSPPWITGCSKDAIAAFYGLPGEKKPHRAMNGVSHLVECYKAVVGFPGA